MYAMSSAAALIFTLIGVSARPDATGQAIEKEQTYKHMQYFLGKEDASAHDAGHGGHEYGSGMKENRHHDSAMQKKHFHEVDASSRPMHDGKVKEMEAWAMKKFLGKEDASVHHHGHGGHDHGFGTKERMHHGPAMQKKHFHEMDASSRPMHDGKMKEMGAWAMKEHMHHDPAMQKNRFHEMDASSRPMHDGTMKEMGAWAQKQFFRKDDDSMLESPIADGISSNVKHLRGRSFDALRHGLHFSRFSLALAVAALSAVLAGLGLHLYRKRARSVRFVTADGVLLTADASPAPSTV